MTGKVFTCAAALLALAATASATVLSDWNLVVRNDLNTTSEVDGSALVGGNVLGTSNYTVQGVTASNGDGLAVGGNIGAGINVQINNGGNLRIAGSVLGNVNLNGGGSIINDPTVPTMVNDAMSFASSVSTSLQGLTPNGTLSGSGNFSAAPTMIDGQMVAVYSISQNDFQNLGQISLTFGAADSVIINVSADANGVVDLIAPPNILSDFTQANSNRILWNFYDATTVLVNNNFNGAMLAPNADLQLTGGGINGSVVVDNISVMNAEIRRNTYTGYVPEPASGLLLVAGLGLALRRR